ncbi:copper-transporting ATPase PAA2, chloroplastic [Tanacetum coccineum]
MTTNLLRISPPLLPKFTTVNPRILTTNLNSTRRHAHFLRPPPRLHHIITAKAVDLTSTLQTSPENLTKPRAEQPPSVLLEVTGMMCGACVTRVKSILSSDARVESCVVNMLTETAAVKVKDDVDGGDDVADELGRKLTECGFPSKKRASGLGIEEKVKKWRESVVRKEELMVESRNRVVFAWTLVALCCGSHASHIAHSVGFHIGHGAFMELLHNSYFKGSLAVGALLGPGRGWCFIPCFKFLLLNIYKVLSCTMHL